MTKRKKKRKLDTAMASALSEATDRLKKLDWESDQETQTLVGRQIARIGSRLIQSIKTEEMSNPRMCALAAGLVSMFLLRLADVPEDEHEDFFLLLMREYHGLDEWMSDIDRAIDLEDSDDSDDDIEDDSDDDSDDDRTIH